MLMGIAIFFYILYFGLGADKISKYKKGNSEKHGFKIEI
jgi:hypothetical protein